MRTIILSKLCLGSAAIVWACLMGCGRSAAAPYDVTLDAKTTDGNMVGKRYELTKDVALIREEGKRAVLMPPTQWPRYGEGRIGGPSRRKGGAWGRWGRVNLAHAGSPHDALNERLGRGAELLITRIISETFGKPPDVYWVQARIESGALYGTSVDVSHLIEDCVPADSIWRRRPVVANDEYLKPVVSTEPEPTMPSLAFALDSEDWAVRHRAVQLLGEIKTDVKQRVSALVDAMDDPDPEVRYEAVEALGRLGPPAREAVATLIPSMKYDRAAEGYCRRVAEALARIGRPVSPVLMDALKDHSWGNRYLAAHGLASLGMEASGAIPGLLEFLLSDLKHAAYGTPLHIGAAIYRISPQEGAAAVLKLLDDPSRDVWRRAARALGAMAPGAEEAIPALIKKAKEERYSYHLIGALGKFGEKAVSAVPVMIAALECGNTIPMVRSTAARALARVGPGAVAAVPALISVLESEDSRTVYYYTLRALGNIGPPAAAAVPVIKRFKKSAAGFRCRKAAREALMKIDQ